MVRKNRKILSFILIFVFIFSYFIPLQRVFAASSTTSLAVSFKEGSVGNGKVQYSLNDGATWTDVTNNNNNISFTVTGDHLMIRIVPNQDYSIDYTGISLRLDGDVVENISSIGLGTNNGYAVPDNIESVSLEMVEFNEEGGGPPPVYDDTAHVSVTVIGTEIENPYGDAASEVRVSVNGDYFVPLANNNVTITPDNEDPEKTYSVATINPMDIGYQDVSESSVVIGIRTQWNTILTDVIINNESYADELPTTKNELISMYRDQGLIYEIEVPKNSNNNYNVVVEGRKQNENEIIMGNFLWDYNPQGYTDPEDKILHSTLQFIRAEYGNTVFTNISDLNAAGGLYQWRDVERQNVYNDIGDGVGSATFPVGTSLTVAIIPDPGYQLVSFGVNEGGFEPQEQIGVYTFEIEGGNFHLQANVESVENLVNTTNANSISNGSIVFGGEENTMNVGTARLDVEDNADLTANQTQSFEEAANDYDIQGVFDISLFNTVFKGSRDASWDTQVNDLNNNATITLGMTNNLSGKDIIVIHETHNGDYETINVDYNEENNTISFATDSFSNYALATKGGGNNTVVDPPVVKHTIDFNTDGGSLVPSVEVEDGDILERPEAPSKDSCTFGGWYYEPELDHSYDFEGPVEGDFTLYARWIDNDDLKDYTVTDAAGNTISFTDEEGHNYNFSLFDILSLSKEEIMSMDEELTDETYEQMLALLNELANQTGELLKLYEINVYEDTAVPNETYDLHEGPFQIKIKISDDMKNYDSYKLVYLKNDYTLGEVVNLTVEGDYLVGTIPHLSTYMLTGSNSNTNPLTNDTIMHHIIMLIISTLCFIGTGITIKKRLNA